MALELKLSCLNLVEQGSIGLMGAIDRLRWLLVEVKRRKEISTMIQEAANTFMEVQRAIMKRLMRSYDPVADQTILIKFFRTFMPTMDNSKSMRSFFIRCKETHSGQYSVEEVNQIIGFWRRLSNNWILCSFWYFLKFLFDVCLLFSTWNRLLYRCISSRPAESAIAVRWHLPSLRLFSLWYRPSDIPLGYRYIPNLPQIMIKSTTYLVNCWCLLDQDDLAVASMIMKEEVTNLLDIIYWLAEFETLRYELFCFAGLGRLLRCITSMIIKRANSAAIMKPLTHLLKKSVATTKGRFSIGYYRPEDKIGNVLPLLSRGELGVFLDKFQDEMEKRSEAEHHMYKHKSIETQCREAIQKEDNLPSLSREDANIVFLPKLVKNAIDSLPPEATTFIPEVGVFTLLHRNKDRLPSLEWAQDFLSLFDRAVEVEPILQEILE